MDAYGSVLTKYFQTGIYDEEEIYSYRIEGTGKNIIPANVLFQHVDEFIKVTDEDSAFRAREMALTEGLLMGYSSGAVMQCLLQIQERLTENDLVVMIFADHGSRYLGKIYNDQWMSDQGFLEDCAPQQPASLYGIKILEPRHIRRLYRSYLKWTKYR